MICVLYPPGGFGSTVEYCIREFSLEFESINAEVSQDGSMHAFKKQFHPVFLDEYVEVKDCEADIATLLYPNFQTDPVECVQFVKQQLPKDTRVVFVLFPDLFQSERNFFFAYHKILVHKNSLFRKSNKTEAYKNWNPDYTSVDEMQIWERREMLTMEFDQSFLGYMVPTSVIEDDWYQLTTSDILYDFQNTMKKIIEFLGLTFVDNNFADFEDKWLAKQKYILDGHALVERIVAATINNEEFCWEPMELAYESFVQYKLKQLGFGLRCYGLNIFPTNSLELRKLLERL